MCENICIEVNVEIRSKSVPRVWLIRCSEAVGYGSEVIGFASARDEVEGASAG